MFVIIVLLWYVMGALIPLYFNGMENGARFGDSFGGVNALFSGLAFAGIIYTILLQQKEIDDNTKHQKKQAFETTFFKLIDLHNSILTDIHGRQLIKRIMGRLEGMRNHRYDSHANYDNLRLAYSTSIPHESLSQINLYLSSIIRMVRHIYSVPLSPEELYFYKSILDSTLSDDERTFIFYHVAFANNGEVEIDYLLELDKKYGFIRLLRPKFFNETHCILLSLLHNKEVIRHKYDDNLIPIKPVTPTVF